MKVFKYNVRVGQQEQIDNIPLAHCVSNREGASVKLPARRDGVEWNVATFASDQHNKEIKYDFPVCFCLGQMRAGTDEYWSWCVLLPKGFEA